MKLSFVETGCDSSASGEEGSAPGESTCYRACITTEGGGPAGSHLERRRLELLERDGGALAAWRKIHLRGWGGGGAQVDCRRAL